MLEAHDALVSRKRMSRLRGGIGMEKVSDRLTVALGEVTHGVLIPPA
jgi:hypothetical protein